MTIRSAKLRHLRDLLKMLRINLFKNRKPLTFVSVADERGFSLIELMIVVAIIGVLSTVATPNFQKMSAKARTVEAKSALSAMFTAEKAYYAESNTYTYCLTQAGYIPEGARRFYTSGFWLGVSGCVSCSIDQNSGQPCNFAPVAWQGTWRNDATFGANSYANPTLAAGGLASSFDVDSTTFQAVAFGSVSTIAIFDVWSITDGRVLSNNQPGF